MEEILSRAQKLGADFADVRFQRSSTLTITADNTGVKIIENGQREGYCTRVLYKRNIGYKNSSVLMQKDADDAIDSTFGNGTAKLAYLKSRREVVPNRQKFPLSAKSTEEKLADINRLLEQCKKLDKRINSVNIVYRETSTEKRYLSTDRRDISSTPTYSAFSIGLVAKDRNTVATGYEPASTHLGYALEVMDLNGVMEKAYDRLKKQLVGTLPKAGEYPIILGPDMTGVFCHEAVGHGAEADLATNGIIGAQMGRKVASEDVNIVDGPALDYPRAVGTLKYDDEGVEAKEVKIIDKGVVSEVMTDRQYAAINNTVPTGNARADGPFSVPIIRTRNTYMKPGKLSLEEPLETVKNGYLALTMSGGTTSKDGTFQFGVMEGHVIRNGRIESSLRDFGVSAYTVETLGNIIGISRDFAVSSGVCGKDGQNAPVGTGGPYVAIKKIKDGGSA